MGEKIRYDSNRVRLRTGEHERKNGQYEYRYTVFGKSYSIYAPTLEALREREENLPSVEQVKFQKADPNRVTLNELYGVWKELKRGLRQNTFCSYCYLYEQYVKESLGHWYITTIRKSDIKRFFNHLADERRLKEGTIEAVQTVLHQVLQIAVDDAWIEKNPSDAAVKELKKSHNFGTTKRQALTKAEQNLLLEFLSNDLYNARWYPITAVLLGTGMRVGEVIGLRWCDLDFETGMIDVNHTLVYCDKGDHKMRFAINDTKTPASKRQIPMTKAVREAFLMERDMQADLGILCDVVIDGYTDFVFLNRFGGVHQQGTLNKAYRRIIRDCNDAEFLKSENPPVLLPKFSCHNLRHTFATRLCESGVNIKAAQTILGHAKISTTMEIYTHMTNELQEQARELMETF